MNSVKEIAERRKRRAHTHAASTPFHLLFECVSLLWTQWWKHAYREYSEKESGRLREKETQHLNDGRRERKRRRRRMFSGRKIDMCFFVNVDINYITHEHAGVHGYCTYFSAFLFRCVYFEYLVCYCHIWIWTNTPTDCPSYTIRKHSHSRNASLLRAHIKWQKPAWKVASKEH